MTSTSAVPASVSTERTPSNPLASRGLDRPLLGRNRLDVGLRNRTRASAGSASSARRISSTRRSYAGQPVVASTLTTYVTVSCRVMREFQRADMTFDVTDSGPADGPVVVLLHGYPENRTSWDAVTPLLVEAGFRVLAPDQRGYSPRARPKGRRAYATQHLAGDVVALLDAAGADKAHVVGHDWGGGVAWTMAELHPHQLLTVTSLTTPHPRAMVKAMVTGTQAFKSWYMFMFQLPALPELAYSDRMQKRLRDTLRGTGLTDEAIDRYITPLREPGAATAALNWYRAIPFSTQLRGDVSVPALYVYATRDAFLGRKAADLTGNYVSAPYRYEVLEGATHWLPEEQPDVVARLVTEHARAHT